MSTKKQSLYAKSVEEAVRHCEAIRRDKQNPEDISLAEYVKDRWGATMESFYEDLGVNPTQDTIQNLLNLPDTSMRWLIPEIFRDSLRLGLRKAPIYPSVIAGEQSVSQTSVTMPAINMSEAQPKQLGVGETITTGDVSFDSKSVKIYKYGRGIKLPYEVMQYVAINLVSIYLQDFGVKMATGIDTMLINTLMNGDQANGSDSIATVGVATANALVFKDLLKVWVRMARLGKTPSVSIAGENMAIEVLELLTGTRLLGTPRVNVDIKTPLPQNSSTFVHGGVAANKLIILDPSTSVIKLNAQPLLIESEKMISNQTEAAYATFTTGFATIFRDSRIALDMSLAFSGNGFPTWMDPSTQETVNF